MSSLQPASFRLWLRLYTHALLLDLQIFSNMKLSDELLDPTPWGFTDIWKGSRHGESVCIKAIRTQDPTRLTEIEKVCASSLLSEVNSVCFTPDLPSQNQWAQVNFASEPTPCHQGFKDTVSVLHHESMDARREHYPVHPDEPGC